MDPESPGSTPQVRRGVAVEGPVIEWQMLNVADRTSLLGAPGRLAGKRLLVEPPQQWWGPHNYSGFFAILRALKTRDFSGTKTFFGPFAAIFNQFG